ncbi:RNA polymerase sigma factor [Sunxiuqinia rutila]|uniref:RNA polymerase sigma factor n=1 Tax=Sunxiuqinia rutila TaxID=1397841 RepID=UPI003D36EC2E
MSKENCDINPEDILQLKKGSRDAFNRLFQSYNQRLYFFALGYLKSEKDAEEVVQETFLKLWERRKAVEPELSMHAYLFKIAFGYIHKRLTKNMKEQQLKHELAGELVHFDQQTANRANYHFLLQYISQVINELPPRQKEIVSLRKLEGYSVKEIAETLSLAVKTVEAHLTAGLKHLRQRIRLDGMNDLLLFIFLGKKKI